MWPNDKGVVHILFPYSWGIVFSSQCYGLHEYVGNHWRQWGAHGCAFSLLVYLSFEGEVGGMKAEMADGEGSPWLSYLPMSYQDVVFSSNTSLIGTLVNRLFTSKLTIIS